MINIEYKEADAYKVLELVGGGTIAHDDKLLLRAVKSDLGIDKAWRDTVDVRHKDGEIELLNWYDRTDGMYLSRARFDKIVNPDMKRYRPQCLRGLDLGYGASVDILYNQVDLYLLNLYDNAGSRYSSALEAMLDLADRGTLTYTPRVNETVKNRREAVRNRTKRYLKPTDYEHNILITGSLGTAIHLDLRASQKAQHLEENTVYLRGYAPADETRYSVKCYDVDLREGRQSTGRIKIETTLHKEYFKKPAPGRKRINVADMTFQPDIQESNNRELEKGLGYAVSLLSEGVREMLAQALDVKTRDARLINSALAQAMLRPERTLSYRVATLERDMVQVKRDVEQLQRATGLK